VLPNDLRRAVAYCGYPLFADDINVYRTTKFLNNSAYFIVTLILYKVGEHNNNNGKCEIFEELRKRKFQKMKRGNRIRDC
jgi:hypothetical protein